MWGGRGRYQERNVMGLIAEFYVGDEEKIVQALKSGEYLDESSMLIKKADFPFHLNLYEDLDMLLEIINGPAGVSPQKFKKMIEEACFLDPEDDPECAIYRMSPGFRDLLADIPANRAREIAEKWIAKLTENQSLDPPKIGRVEKKIRKIEDAIQYCVFAPVVYASITVVWLFSPKFRKECSENKRRRSEKSKMDATSKDEYTLVDAVVELVGLCQYAKSNNQSVLFFWCL